MWHYKDITGQTEKDFYRQMDSVFAGFANYNGGVRFYPYFTKHVHDDG